jgi:hypothetical protein
MFKMVQQWSSMASSTIAQDAPKDLSVATVKGVATAAVAAEDAYLA